MKDLLIITPVKDSIELTEQTIYSVKKSIGENQWDYIVYDDFSKEETSIRLDDLARKLDFDIIHLSDIIEMPSPNYRYILQDAQKKALLRNKHLVIIESDVVVNALTLKSLLSQVSDGVGMVASVTKVRAL